MVCSGRFTSTSIFGSASARVSDGEFEAVKMICDWAARRNLLHKVEVLGFVDGHTSVDWIQRTGCRVINLLCKGSLKHCTQQLKKTPEEHLASIIDAKTDNSPFVPETLYLFCGRKSDRIKVSAQYFNARF